MRIRRIAASTILLFLLVALAGAVALAPLPEFHVTSAEGLSVKSADLPAKGNWLLIYVQSKNQFSDSLLGLLKREQYPGLAEHAIILVGGSLDELKAMRSRHPDLEQASWYADSKQEAFTQLKLHGVPVVLGIKEQTITWSLNGILSDSKVSQSILNSWLK